MGPTPPAQGLSPAGPRTTNFIGTAWYQGDLSPIPVPCLGLSTGQRSRISPCARTGVWWKTKHQSWAEPLRQLVFRLPGKTRHLILPSGTSAGTQQLLGPSQAVPNPSLSKHPSTIPYPIPLLRGGPAPHSVLQGPPSCTCSRTEKPSKPQKSRTHKPLSLPFALGRDARMTRLTKTIQTVFKGHSLLPKLQGKSPRAEIHALASDKTS